MSENDRDNYIIHRIRPILAKDEKAVAQLFASLDTCNASPDRVAQLIARTRTAAADFKSLTFVSEQLNPDGTFSLNGTGTLKMPADDDSIIRMYTEAENGLSLQPVDIHESVEFASIIVDPSSRGGGVGKALTLTRALVARLFQGHIGADRMFVEFLPEYHDEANKSNPFWTDLILPKLDLPAITEHLNELGYQCSSSDDVLRVIVTGLSPEQRNDVVDKYFPHLISSEEITPAAREITSSIGKSTVGARQNLERIYTGGLEPLGYFPADGGTNYTADLSLGGQGVRTVKSTFTLPESDDDRRIMANADTFALVFKPLRGVPSELRSLQMFYTPVISTRKFAKLPSEIAENLGLSDGDPLSVRLVQYVPNIKK